MQVVKIDSAFALCEGRVLQGRAAQQAEHLVPLLFALCGTAQAHAARLAVSATRGESCAPLIEVDVQLEALREHLWRCLLDLPPLLGEAPLQQEFVSGMHSVKAGRRDALHILLNSEPITSLRSRVTQMDEPFTPSPSVLPPLDAKKSLVEWLRLNTAFCRRPEWRGAAAVTGAIARKHASSGPFFVAYWLARFDELIDWASDEDKTGCVGTVSAEPVANGVGRALVETARGLLMREVVLNGEIISEYLIVAPTEWNFHPQGVLHDCLLGAAVQDREVLKRYIARIVATLDPCVPWELDWA